MSALKQAIAAAQAADDAFEAAVKAAGFRSRWDHGATDHESVHKVYMAKCMADHEMHHEFNTARAMLARSAGETP